MIDAIETDGSADIAIVGMSGRFPGAQDVEAFWSNLVQGVESISRFTDDDARAAGADEGMLVDPGYVRAGGVLEHADLFDAGFFGINPREAESLDPQLRLFLECAWECLEHAGYPPDACPGLVGVYAGAAMSSYLAHALASPHLVRSIGEYQILLGNDKDSIPTFTSYKLNLRGPSMAVQTACSTSLVAVVVACQGLLSYQCDVALAGGVRIALPQHAGYAFQEGGILSPDGHCRPFDAQARGTVGGNGVALVALKRLADALADGDCIHAVIKGAAVNNDGALKVGYTAPSVDGQAQVIATAHAAGGIDPRTVAYIEAHGTATDLGDPIEVAALTQAFRLGTPDTGFCAVGSVKGNVGHLDTAAGIAGLIKAVLAVERATIPASLHFTQPNAKIDFAASPFYVNHRLAEWPATEWPRRAGVSSFGIGGTNAHVVIEEAPPPVHQPSHRQVHLLALSAKSPAALDAVSRRLREHLVQHPDTDLADAAFTLQVGRSPMPHRRALVCRDFDEAIAALDRSMGPEAESTRAAVRRLAFLFPGQGAQHVGMAAGVYEHEPTFRDEIQRCARLLRPHVGLDILDVVYPSRDSANAVAARLDETALAQPAIFAVEYALACLWQEWGLRPHAMLGHSIGEYVAACLAGVFTLDDALALVAARGQLMQALPGGAMLAVGLSEQGLAEFLDSEVSLAAANGPASTVAAGPFEVIAALEARLGRAGVASQRLRTSHAFHSASMDAVLGRFRDLVASVQLQAPTIPFVSNVTGRWITGAEATDPDYWARHLRQPVRFGDGLSTLLADHRTLLEIGPGRTLCGLARQQSRLAAGTSVVASLPGPRDGTPDESCLLGALGTLWASGLEVDWTSFHRHSRRRRTPLPTYPFERQRYWVEPDADEVEEAARTDVAPSPLAADIADWFYVPAWRSTAPSAALPRLPRGNHRWLVFVDACGLGAAVARAAATAGIQVVTVAAGGDFVRHSDVSFSARPGARRDVDMVLADLAGRAWVADTVVHLWTVTDTAPAADAEADFDEQLEAGFSSLVVLAQALGESAPGSAVRIIVVSNHVQDLGGSETLSPAKATVLGPCRVIRDEYPDVSCRHVDVEWPAADQRRADALVASLLAEVLADASEVAVALRGRHRWTEALERVRFEPVAESAVRDRGVYLITGGMGGIGFTLAEHLARTHRARLVLVGRRSFTPKAAWDAVAAAAAEDATSQRVRTLRDLERDGAEIVVETADVADVEAMRGVVDRALARFGVINGVFHCAGLAGGRMIQFHTPADAARVMRPKALGAIVLERVLEGVPLDFMVWCSSLTSLQGGVGQVDYCAANAFLDALATQLVARHGRRVTAVNWDTWQAVGMAVDTVVPRDLEMERAESLARGIPPADGAIATTRVIGRGLAQVAVSRTDLHTAVRQRSGIADLEATPDGAVVPDDAHITVYSRPALGNEYIAPRNDTESRIARIWAELLGLEPIGATDDFFALGGHSLLALQVVSRLREAFHAELGVRLLFERPTVAGLAEYLIEAEARAAAGDADLADALDLVEGLSEEELQAWLARDAGVSEDEGHR